MARGTTLIGLMPNSLRIQIYILFRDNGGSSRLGLLIISAGGLGVYFTDLTFRLSPPTGSLKGIFPLLLSVIAFVTHVMNMEI